jgi:hypothetical protein
MDLSESQATFPSDSEIYDANYDAEHSNSQDSEEQTSHSSSPLILYSPPTFLSIARGAAINLLLPFINGLMLGFGELFAHEAAFRLGWGGTRVRHILLCGGRGRIRVLLGPVGREERSGLNEQQADITTRSSPDTETQERWDLAWRSKKTRSKGEDGAAGRWTRIPLLSRVRVAPAHAHGKCTGAPGFDCIGRWQVTLDINS